ncbi:MAG: nodulation protein NfeD, partial [Acidimicrobiia bacterium]
MSGRLAILARRAAAIVVGLMAAGSIAAATTEDNRVLLIEIEGAITPVVAEFVADAAVEAGEGGYEALVITIDTPGGLDLSMRAIVQALLNATTPTVVYVSPEGARAASAGTFITMAAHLAAMAPATSIGAATPVDLQGGEITDKIINDAVAFGVSVAERTGRDVTFAEEAVREGRSVTAREALELGVVDVVAGDLDDLLSQIHGREITSLGVRLDTDGAAVERKTLGPFREVLGRLADPNIAFLLLSLGTLAIVYEAANPGLGFSGIAGVIMVVLAFFALSVLPVRAAGLTLFVLAVGLLVAELFVSGVGVLAAGGAVALLLSGLFLFEGPVRVSPALVWPSAVVLGVASVGAGRLALQARRRPVTMGPETLLGRTVTIKFRGDRQVAFLEGAWWDVRSETALKEGAKARVTATEGVRLKVEEVKNDV